jgi:hypothetical protein
VRDSPWLQDISLADTATTLLDKIITWTMEGYGKSSISQVTTPGPELCTIHGNDDPANDRCVRQSDADEAFLTVYCSPNALARYPMIDDISNKAPRAWAGATPRVSAYQALINQ